MPLIVLTHGRELVFRELCGTPDYEFEEHYYLTSFFLTNFAVSWYLVAGFYLATLSRMTVLIHPSQIARLLASQGAHNQHVIRHQLHCCIVDCAWA